MGIFEMIVMGFFAGIATLVGGILGVILPVHRKGCMGLIMGFGAGVMIGVSLFSLMPEAYYFVGSCLPVGIGFLLGFGFMLLLSVKMNREMPESMNGDIDYKKVGILMALGIGLHNFPEGIAMGAGFQGGTYLGFTVAFAIMLHNIPEGICISAPLAKARVNYRRILGISALAGFVTPIGAVVGWLITGDSMVALSMGMGFAAGAMIYISFSQVLKLSTRFMDFGIFLGILLTFFLS